MQLVVNTSCIDDGDDHRRQNLRQHLGRGSILCIDDHRPLQYATVITSNCGDSFFSDLWAIDLDTVPIDLTVVAAVVASSLKIWIESDLFDLRLTIATRNPITCYLRQWQQSPSSISMFSFFFETIESRCRNFHLCVFNLKLVFLLSTSAPTLSSSSSSFAENNPNRYSARLALKTAVESLLKEEE